MTTPTAVFKAQNILQIDFWVTVYVILFLKLLLAMYSLMSSANPVVPVTVRTGTPYSYFWFAYFRFLIGACIALPRCRSVPLCEFVWLSTLLFIIETSVLDPVVLKCIPYGTNLCQTGVPFPYTYELKQSINTSPVSVSVEICDDCVLFSDRLLSGIALILEHIWFIKLGERRKAKNLYRPRVAFYRLI